MFMGFILHIYIIFGTNLLTGGPAHIAVFFAYFNVSKKRNIKRGPNGMKPPRAIFLGQTQSRGTTESKWNETFASDLFGTNVIQRTWSGSQETNEAATRVEGAPPCWARPLSHGPLGRPLTYFFLLYIPIYPETIKGATEEIFPPP